MLPPARADLVAVPLPPLDPLEPPVVRQIDQLLRTFMDNAAGLDRGALADAYGQLGQVYQAYELFDAAEASYENARRLAPRDYRWPHLLGYLRQQTGRHKRADLDLAQAGGHQGVDPAPLVGRGHGGRDRLQAVAGADLADEDLWGS